MDQLVWRQRFVSGTLQADKLGNVFQILPEDECITFGHHRNITHAELQQPFASTGVVEHVDGFEVDAFARKKLFRPETAASARLREENEFLSDRVHDGFSS
jgi:hypothetical protein